MKNLTSALGLVAAIAVTAGATTARAADYQLFYIGQSGDGTVADGQIDVVNGVAVSGDLQVFTGPNAGSYDLVAGSGNSLGLNFDNKVSPDASGFLDAEGLLFSGNGQSGDLPELDISFNALASGGAPADEFSIDGPNKAGLESYGIATLTPMNVVEQEFIHANANNAADGGSTVALLAGGLTGLAFLRRKLGR